MFISVTRIHLKSLSKFFPFMALNGKIQKQIKASPGLISSKVRMQNPWVYWTLTAWQDKESMMRFRNNGTHMEAMKKSRELSSDMKSLNWEGEKLPGWREAAHRLLPKI